MGSKAGASAEQKAANKQRAADLATDLTGLGDADVRAKAMFGGHGIFADDIMFAMVTSDGRTCLRTDDSNVQDYLDRGMERFHERMPYHEVPAEVLADDAQLRSWAATSLAVARAAKK